MARISAVALVVVVTGGSMAGCGDDGDGDGRPSFEERLALIPASVPEGGDADEVVLMMGDIDRAASYAGVEPPEDLDAQPADYVTSVTGMSWEGDVPEVAALLPRPGYERMGRHTQQEFVDDVGWSARDLDWFVEHQVPPNVFTVMGGDFDESRLDSALGEREDDIWRLGEDDFGLDGAPTAARPIGENLRMALDGDHLIVARATPPVEDALGSGGGTLADDATLQGLAAELDREDVYSAILERGDFGLETAAPAEAAPPQALEQLEQEVLPEPFDGFAVGLAFDEDEAVAVLVYVLTDADAADAQAEAVEDMITDGRSVVTRMPYSELFSVDEIRTDGALVVARLDIADDQPPSAVYRLAAGEDSLAIHR